MKSTLHWLVIFIMGLLISPNVQAQEQYKNIFEHAEYFTDATNELTINQVIDQPFKSVVKPNFGFNTERIWLRLDLKNIPEIDDYNYLKVGNSRTALLSFFVMDSLGTISKINPMNFIIDQLIRTKQLSNYNTLYVKTSAINWPTSLQLKLIEDATALVRVDLKTKIIVWATGILLAIMFIGVVTYYFINKELFYFFYAIHLLTFILFFFYDSGLGKHIFSHTQTMIFTLAAHVMYFAVSLPLVYISRITPSIKAYKRYAIYASLMLAINIVFPLFISNKSVIAQAIVLELVVMQAFLFVYLLIRRVNLFQLKETWFFYILLISILLPNIKALNNFGIFPEAFLLEISFEIYVLIEISLWLSYIILSIRTRATNQLKVQLDVAQLKKDTKYALLKGQEQERHWFGKELHDNIGSTLSAIRLLLTTNPNASKIHLKKINRDLHLISSTYVSPHIEDNSLQDELIKYLEIINQSNQVKVHLEFDSKQVEELDKFGKLNIYRSIQEAINNSIKHGEADEIIVQILDNGNEALIYIEDNGKGFKKEITEGLGLSNLRNRLEQFNLQLSIKSEPSIGSQIEMRLDLQN